MTGIICLISQLMFSETLTQYFYYLSNKVWSNYISPAFFLAVFALPIFRLVLLTFCPQKEDNRKRWTVLSHV